MSVLSNPLVIFRVGKILNPLTGKLVYLNRGCERLTRLRRGASKASSSNAGKSSVGEGDREGVILDEDVAAGLLLLAVVRVVVVVVVVVAGAAAAEGDNELLLPLDLPDTCLRPSSSTDRFPACRGFFATRLASSDDARLESLLVSFLPLDADAVALVLVDDDASAGVVVVAAVAVAGVVVVLAAGESCADGCIQEYFFCDKFLKKALLLLVPSPMVVC